MVRTRRSQQPVVAAKSGDDSGDVDEGIVSPVRRGRSRKTAQTVTNKKAKAKPAETPSKAGKTGKGRKPRGKSTSEEEEEEEEENEVPVVVTPSKGTGRGRGRGGRARGRGAVATSPLTRDASESSEAPNDNDEDNEESFQFVAPKPKPVPKTVLKPTRQESEDSTSTLNTSIDSTSSVASSTASSTTATAANKANTTRSGFSLAVRKEITEFVIEGLDECQRLDGRQRKTLVASFRRQFYKDQNPATANDYQKYFTQSLWTHALLFFKAPNSHPVAAALKFLHDIILNIGTPEDKAKVGFKLATYPLYYYILKLYVQCHMDERPLVRLRLISVAHAIFSQYRDIEPIQGNAGMKNQLLQCFLERLKDRYAYVRALAVASLKFYADDDREVLKRLKYFGRFDPSADVRKAVLVALSDINVIKATFFYEFVFDSEAKVRVEAFKSLATRPLTNLKPEEACKALIWGLSHDDQSKTVVVAKLLPVWMDLCNKSPIDFLRHLGVTTKPSVVTIIMDGVYLNNFTDTFEAIDLSFLNDDKVIPIENLTLESVMFWLYLIKKFGNTRHNKKKLVPQPEFMIEYLCKLIDAIHTENRNARQDDRDEDGTLLICMTYMIPIILTIGIEEANRRRLGEILKAVLLDPVMDEAPVIKMGVDALHRILDKREFGEKMMEVFQAVFEPDQTIMDQTLDGTPRSRSGFRPKSNLGSEEASPHVAPGSAKEGLDPDHENMDIDIPADVPETTPARRHLTEKELLAMKNKLCKLALERLRLGEEKSNAIKLDNYLEAHRIQIKIDVLCAEEKVLRGKMELSNGTVGSMSDFTVSSSIHSSQRSNQTSMMEMEDVELEERANLSPMAEKSRSTTKGSRNNTASRTMQGEQDFPLSQATTAGGDRIGISLQNILKGVMMMNRFLSCSPKITPFIRQFYELYALSNFTDDLNETQTRNEILSFLCHIGLIDTEEKRKIMGLVITALEHDTDPHIKNTAFKCMVDLLCRYDMKDFRFAGETDLVYSVAPPDYNNVDASPLQLQAMFVSLVDRFATGAGQNLESESVKAMGIIKLLMANRITSEFVVADVLCMWSDCTYRGTKIPYEIGIWLPLYTNASVVNGKLVCKALFHSVLRIANANERNSSNLQGADVLKLVDFVLPCISNSHIKPREDETVNLHEDMYESIINHILQHTKKTVNLHLVQILPKLTVESEDKAKLIVVEIGHALLKLGTMPPTATINTLKTSLKKAGKRIAIRFEELEEELMDILNKADEKNNAPNFQTSDDEASDTDHQTHIFSDSDVE